MITMSFHNVCTLTLSKPQYLGAFGTDENDRTYARKLQVFSRGGDCLAEINLLGASPEAIEVHEVTDWRWLPDPPQHRDQSEGEPLAAALARVRASSARLGRTIEEWESKFGHNQEDRT